MIGGNIKYYRSLAKADAGPPFITVWNTELGSSTGPNQILLPLVAGSAGNYNFIVDWGDGIKERITSYGDAHKLHTYNSPGIYTVTITGLVENWNFAISESTKIIEIQNWGCFQPTGSPCFYGCSNLDVTATDSIDLSKTTSIAGLFRGCVNLVGNSSFANWDTAHIQLFGSGNNGFIRDCRKFNAPISGWNTSSATAYNEFAFGANVLDQNFGSYNMENATLIGNMLRDTNLSVENYSNTLIGWASQNLQPNLTLRSRRLRYNAEGQAARQYIINNFNWTFLEDSLAT